VSYFCTNFFTVYYVPTVAVFYIFTNIYLLVLSSLLLLASLVLLGSTILWHPCCCWLSPVVGGRAVAGVPGLFGVPAIAGVLAVVGVLAFFVSPTIVGVPAVVCVHAVVGFPLLLLARFPDLLKNRHIKILRTSAVGLINFFPTRPQISDCRKVSDVGFDSHYRITGYLTYKNHRLLRSPLTPA
jgi:hypothetical protein